VRLRRDQLRDLARTLHAVSPLDVLARGYAVLTCGDPAAVITSVNQVAAGDRVAAQLKDGTLSCIVESLS
jgi:exodeoxyribonuclease VII large subunit